MRHRHGKAVCRGRASRSLQLSIPLHNGTEGRKGPLPFPHLKLGPPFGDSTPPKRDSTVPCALSLCPHAQAPQGHLLVLRPPICPESHERDPGAFLNIFFFLGSTVSPRSLLHPIVHSLVPLPTWSHSLLIAYTAFSLEPVAFPLLWGA